MAANGRSTSRGAAGPLAGLMVLLAGASAASAHPFSQGSLDVVVFPDHVTVRVRVSFEEVSVTQMFAPAVPAATTAAASRPAPPAAGGAAARACQWHAEYLATHLRLAFDGVPLTGRVVGVFPPAAGAGATPGDERAAYDLAYDRPAATPPGPARPTAVSLRSDVLADGDFPPGTSWEATYVVRIGQAGGVAADAGLLLTAGDPITFRCARPPATRPGGDQPVGAGTGAGPPPAGVDGVDRPRLVRAYLAHGVHHILTGYDHLLFVAALVLAATTAWDLVKVVTAFTLAHTVTLTLAALDLVHVPGRVVEPMIAGSIVFVAVQNVFWPGHGRGRGRTAVAFLFGLFHGLGFAGGLLDAMQDMPGRTVYLAIAAFSGGVELGHQIVVLPIFAALTALRRSHADGPARERASSLALRYGSVAISVAGAFHLVTALWTISSPGSAP